MRFALVALTAAAAASLSLSAQSPATPAQPRSTRELVDLFPGDPKLALFTVTADERRTYYTTPAGEVWQYDRLAKAKTRVLAGPAWDLNLSAVGDTIVYTKAGERRHDQFIWTTTLDKTTGLAVGAERQLSASPGDVPAISPDGSLVAFARDDASGVGQSLVVVPMKGGAERLVAPGLPASVANIRWTPDGRTLYFGVNPPVRCDPEWSCLPLAAELRQPPGTIRRVAITGGPVSTVATARNLLLGLSPDGSTLLYPDMKDARQWIVANPDGSRRDTLNLPPPQTPVGWLRASTLIVASGGFVRRLRTMSLVDGSAQLLADNATSFAEPQLSSDGSTVMMMIRGSRAAIHLRGVDGSAVRTLQLPEAGAGSPSWSPDQKWIAYIAYGEDPKPHVSMVEVATGRVQTVYEFDNDQTVVIRWRTDSQALVLSNIVTKPPEARRVVFRSVDLAGRMTVLRDVPLGPPPSGGVAIGDAAALLIRNGQKDYRVIRLDGDPSERELPVQTTDGSPVMITSDTQWAAVRQAPAAATAGSPATMLDIARIDGSARWTISLPFVMLGIPPRPVPGADAFVVFEARRPDADTGVYLVSARTNTVRKLFTYAPQTGLPEITVSADGRRLVYLISEPIPPQVQAIDLSAPRREKE